MQGTIRIDDESTNGCYVVQLTSEPYTLQEYKEMKSYTSLVTAYAGDIVCNAIFLNSVHNANYQLIPMNKVDGDITVRLKQVLLSNITMTKTDKTNKFPKRYNKR